MDSCEDGRPLSKLRPRELRLVIGANFDLATSLAGAKNLADIVELQSAFWRKQFGVLTAQAEEVRVLSTQVTADAVEQVKRGGVHELRKAI